ncbi:MAG: hypothetical protein V3U87_05750 [Methylococcaceae bacterium]
MYFWKIEVLKEDIKNGLFTEKDRFIYGLIYIVLCAAGMEAMMRMPIESPNIWDTIGSLGNIAIPLIGTIFVYRSNGGKTGKDFLGRYFSIGFVVSIRFLVLLIPMFAALVAYYIYAFPDEEIIVSTPADKLPFIIWYALLFWRINKHVSDVKIS